MSYINEHPNYSSWRDNMVARNWTVGSVDWLAEAGGDEDFAIWLFLANRHMMRTVGLGINDIEDYLWRDSFDADEKPRDAMKAALVNAGWDEDEDGEFGA